MSHFTFGASPAELAPAEPCARPFAIVIIGRREPQAVTIAVAAMTPAAMVMAVMTVAPVVAAVMTAAMMAATVMTAAVMAAAGEGRRRGAEKSGRSQRNQKLFHDLSPCLLSNPADLRGFQKFSKLVQSRSLLHGGSLRQPRRALTHSQSSNATPEAANASRRCCLGPRRDCAGGAPTPARLAGELSPV